MNYASIVPLIGGETIAMEKVFKKRPEYIISYEDFQANDTHLVEYYKREVPYYLLGNDRNYDLPSVDVINTVCPCAGLSSLNTSASSDAAANDWMLTSANYVLGTLKPKVFWGENAPRLASKMGEPVVENLRTIGREFGYTFSLYKTKSIIHGLGQVRDRSFYFFWKGDRVPQLEYIKRNHEKIEDTIRSVGRNPDDPMNVLTNEAIPSQDPYYRYVLEEMEDGISHTDFFKKISKTENVLHYFEDNGGKYNVMSKWMDKNGFDKHAKKAERMHYKLADGGNIMIRTTIVPKDYIGAFVGHQPYDMTHPDADRYLTVRECLDIMKMPKDFHLMGGVKNLNMICQNVPVTTAMDMASNVKDFLHGKSEMIEAEFLIQDNKARTYHIEKAPNTLEAFL